MLSTREIIKEMAMPIITVLSIVALLWIIGSTVAVWTGHVEKGDGNFWGLCATETESEVQVTACVKSQGDRYWTITVEDAKGEQWAYYDDEYREIGTVLNCDFNGNEITDVFVSQ